MDGLLHINLIRLFGFYLAATFLIGIVRRLQLYSASASLVLSLPGRWPRVFELIRGHRLMFLTGSTLRPMAMTLILMVVYMTASRAIWPHANISMNDLAAEWWMIPVVAVPFAGMLFIDTLAMVRVGRLDEAATIKSLDEAEHWLGSWKAPVVSALTFGWIRPRQIVHTEVEAALRAGQELLTWSLRWMSMQYGFRIAFGLSLWLAWAVHPAK